MKGIWQTTSQGMELSVSAIADIIYVTVYHNIIVYLA